ncbi:MAG: hypothetical protein P1U58_05720 [Verrucomicrobiales bacterium]|nr:hypothetical protein [Verrucomicrobiales bacterium]
MPKHEQNPGERWRRRPPKLILRWLLRFLAWSSVVTLIAIALAAVIAFSVYLNRARIVNDILGLYVEPFDVSVEKIDLYPIGEVTIQNLRLSPKGLEADEPTLSVPEITLSYDFQKLRLDRQLKSVRFESPLVRLDDKALSALTKKSDRKTSTSAPPDFSKFAIFTESLSINNGMLFLDLDGIPPVTGNWQLETPAFKFDEAGNLASPITLELSAIQLEDKTGGEEIELLSAGLILNQELTRFEIPYLILSGINTTITPEWFVRTASKTDTPAATTDLTGSGLATNPVEWIVRNISLGNSTFSIQDFDGSSGGVALPDMTFNSAFELEEIRTVGGKLTSPGAIEFSLTDIAIGSTEAQLASASSISVEAESLQSILDHRIFSAIEIADLEVVMTDETLSRCRIKTDPPGAKQGTDPGLPWIIESLSLNDGKFVMRETNFGETEAPHLETAIAGTLRDLRFGGQTGFASAEPSEIRFSNTRLFAPGVAVGVDPLIELDRAELAGKWSDFNFNNQLDRLAMRGPKFNFTDETLGNWLNAADDPPESTGPLNRPVYKISALEVTDGKIVADSQFAKGKVPKVFADFSIETKEGADVEPFDYKFVFENLKLRNHSIDPIEPDENSDPNLFPDNRTTPGINESEVLSVRKIELSATAEALQRTREVEKVKVTGAVLRVGEGLKSITDSGKGENQEDTEGGGNEVSELPTWILNQVEITQSQVRFESLIPQITGLEFAIETKLIDVPLSPDGLLAQEKLQKVELAGIEIKDPYNSFITVAFLPTIFVEFSLAGLANQEIEKIDLIGPALHVGQGLFWWIEYQRKFREQNEGASVGLDDGGTIENSPDWEIKTINATAGKIVIAPTGIPIGMVPFPFNATTNMQDGRIELKLNIPDEEGYVYRFPDYEVNLYGLTGNIEFNVPIQQVSNNIVQVFELDRFVWKDYEADNLYLSVTFDENGVYGELGGEAYGGYAEAGFNFYLNDPGKWDAWVAGTEMDTRPITQVLVPDNFEMEGLVSLKLISEGRDKVLGESSGEIQTVGPGWFDVTKFDAILENLPDDWSSLQRSLTELGLIALKRFDYDRGAGSLYLTGQEGNLDLRFAGSYGTRELNLHLHDNRNTTPKVNQHTDNDNLLENVAEAASEDP